MLCKFCYEREAGIVEDMCDKCADEYYCGNGVFWQVLLLILIFAAVFFSFIMFHATKYQINEVSWRGNAVITDKKA